MPEPLTPERRVEIMAAMKERGLSANQAASEFHVGASTIRNWIKKKVDNAHSSSSEMIRLRRENQLLKEIVANQMIEKVVGGKNDRGR